MKWEGVDSNCGSGKDCNAHTFITYRGKDYVVDS